MNSDGFEIDLNGFKGAEMDLNRFNWVKTGHKRVSMGPNGAN